MIRQAHHERNQQVAIHPEHVEGLNQSFRKVSVLTHNSGAHGLGTDVCALNLIA
jgi:hypothetical protein